MNGDDPRYRPTAIEIDKIDPRYTAIEIDKWMTIINFVLLLLLFYSCKKIVACNGACHWMNIGSYSWDSFHCVNVRREENMQRSRDVLRPVMHWIQLFLESFLGSLHFWSWIHSKFVVYMYMYNPLHSRGLNHSFESGFHHLQRGFPFQNEVIPGLLWLQVQKECISTHVHLESGYTHFTKSNYNHFAFWW